MRQFADDPSDEPEVYYDEPADVLAEVFGLDDEEEDDLDDDDDLDDEDDEDLEDEDDGEEDEP